MSRRSRYVGRHTEAWFAQQATDGIETVGPTDAGAETADGEPEVRQPV